MASERYYREHGLTIHVDLTPDVSPLDDRERAATLGRAPDGVDHEPIHVLVPGSEEHPRATASTPGVMTPAELRAAFARAQDIGLLDPEALRQRVRVSNGARRLRCSTR